MKRNMHIGSATALIAVLALMSPAWADVPPASAANAAQQEKQVAKLQVDGGVIMTSKNQAPFVSGATDDPLFSRQRLMVSEQSSATVIFNDGCRQKYDKPGVYEISANCTPPVVFFSGGGGVPVAGLVVAGALVGGLIGYNLHHCPSVSH